MLTKLIVGEELMARGAIYAALKLKKTLMQNQSICGPTAISSPSAPLSLPLGPNPLQLTQPAFVPFPPERIHFLLSP